MGEESDSRQAGRDQYNINSVGPGSAIGPEAEVKADNIAGGDIHDIDINIPQNEGGGTSTVALIVVVALIVIVALIIIFALTIGRGQMPLDPSGAIPPLP